MSVWITCAVNGGGVSRAETPYVPVTPAEIAADALAAAREGAAVVHIHVRDPATGRASHEVALYREVSDRIRARDADLLIHFTGGGGGALATSLSAPAVTAGAAAAIQTPEARLAHLGPAGADLTGLDCGSFSWGMGGDVWLAPTDMLYRQAAYLGQIGVRPELTVFDLGQMALAVRMLADGAVPANTPFCIVFGMLWGAPPRPAALQAMLDLMPEGADWSAGSKGEAHHALASLIAERGGGIRTGIEDHPVLAGRAVTNAELTAIAAGVLAQAGVEPLGARALRRHLGL
ncbi:MAG: 3-keto-5-aminohexanoate cleavage protein [Paracoccaceae bacterium]